MTTNRAVRAAVYCRISSDKRGDGAGVERQRDDLVKLCGARGWDSTPQLVYEDNDQSAFGAKARPAWRRMLDDADRGLIDVLVAWHDDRLWRDVTEQQLVFKLLGDCGVKTIATPGRDYDTASGDDLVMSGVGALFAQKESMDKRRRLTRKMEQLARDGMWSGGFRGFGYSPDHMSINEEEATLVRDAARRIVAGESGQSIAREWNRAGVTTVTGKQWRGQAVRYVLASPAITGLRVHRGEIIGDAKWPAIIDRGLWEAVRDAVASKPGQRVGHPQRTHLLSGWPLRCGLCGGELRSQARNGGAQSYTCSTQKLDGANVSSGCGGIRVAAEPLEKLVVEAVFAAFDAGALDKLRATEVDHDADLRDALTQLHAAEAKLLAMEERYLLGDVSRQAYVGVRDRLTTERDGLRKRLATSQSQAFKEDLPHGADELRTWWDNANIDRKRAFMQLFFEYVTVKRASHRGAKFSADRIDIRWLV
jgi:site-specific DNA recombinase